MKLSFNEWEMDFEVISFHRITTIYVHNFGAFRRWNQRKKEKKKREKVEGKGEGKNLRLISNDRSKECYSIRQKYMLTDPLESDKFSVFPPLYSFPFISVDN